MKISVKYKLKEMAVELSFGVGALTVGITMIYNYIKVLLEGSETHLMYLSLGVAFLLILSMGYILKTIRDYNIEHKEEHLFIVERLEHTYAIIEDKLLNDFQNQLTKTLYRELKDLDNEGLAEKALWSYFRKKLNDVYSRYTELKVISSLNPDFLQVFKRDLLGSGAGELASLYSNWHPMFLQEVDRINADSVEEFLKMLKLFRPKDHNDKINTIKNYGNIFFEANIQKILKMFKRYPPLSQGDNVLSYADLLNKLSEGEKGLEIVIDQLQTLENIVGENKSILVSLSSRYHELQIRQLRGEIAFQDTEYNKLRSSLINFINKLKDEYQL